MRRRINLKRLLSTDPTIFNHECLIFEDSDSSKLYEVWKKDKTLYKKIIKYLNENIRT